MKLETHEHEHEIMLSNKRLINILEYEIPVKLNHDIIYFSNKKYINNSSLYKKIKSTPHFLAASVPPRAPNRGAFWRRLNDLLYFTPST